MHLTSHGCVVERGDGNFVEYYVGWNDRVNSERFNVGSLAEHASLRKTFGIGEIKQVLFAKCRTRHYSKMNAKYVLNVNGDVICVVNDGITNIDPLLDAHLDHDAKSSFRVEFVTKNIFSMVMHIPYIIGIKNDGTTCIWSVFDNKNVEEIHLNDVVHVDMKKDGSMFVVENGDVYMKNNDALLRGSYGNRPYKVNKLQNIVSGTINSCHLSDLFESGGNGCHGFFVNCDGKLKIIGDHPDNIFGYIVHDLDPEEKVKYVSASISVLAIMCEGNVLYLFWKTRRLKIVGILNGWVTNNVLILEKYDNGQSLLLVKSVGSDLEDDLKKMVKLQ